MMLQRWDEKTRTYKPHTVPDRWKVRTMCMDMDETVNCIACGRTMTFGEGYTSKRFHTFNGMGFCECADCYNGYEKQMNGGCSE